MPYGLILELLFYACLIVSTIIVGAFVVPQCYYFRSLDLEDEEEDGEE